MTHTTSVFVATRGALLVLLSAIAPACASAPVAPAAAPPYQGGDGIVVTVAAPNYDELPFLDQSASGAPGSDWRRVCQAPCNVAVDPRGLYRIAGGSRTNASQVTDSDGNGTGVYTESTSSVRDSGPFSLDSQSQRQTLTVSGATTSARTLGVVFMGASAAYFVPAVLAFTGSFSHDDDFNNMFRWTFGLPMAVAGLSFLIVGAWFAFDRTSVTDAAGRTLAREIPKAPQGMTWGPTGIAF